MTVTLLTFHKRFGFLTIVFFSLFVININVVTTEELTNAVWPTLGQADQAAHDFQQGKTVKSLAIKRTMDYGRPMKPFFIEIQNFWAWADKLGR